MAAVAHQTNGGRAGNDQIETIWYVEGAEDRDDAIAAINSARDASIGTLVPGQPTVDDKGVGIYIGTLIYGKFVGDEPDVTEGETAYSIGTFSMSGGGSGQTVYRSIQTIATYVPAGKTPTNYGGAINVTKDGDELKVEGVDDDFPEAHFTITRRYQANSVTWTTKLQKLIELRKHVNESTLTVTVRVLGTIEFEAGTVIFDYAEVSEPDEKNIVTITYHFRWAENIEDDTVGTGDDEITGIDSEGWDYKWYSFAKAVDPDSHLLTSKVVQVNVEQMKYRADLNELFP